MKDNPLLEAVDLFTLPLWSLYVLIIVLLAGGAIIGYRMGRRLFLAEQHLPEDQRGKPSETTLSAFLALLGLLLAFTYSFALSQFDDRRNALLVEANAIGTAFVQAMLMEEPYRTTYRETLAEYAGTRIFRQAVSFEEASVAAQLADSLALQGTLTMTLQQAIENRMPPPIATSMTSGLTGVLDAHSIRIQAGSQSIPAVLKLVLAVVSVLAIFSVGHNSGVRGRPLTWRTMSFTALLIIVLCQIFDLERPTEGMLNLPQKIMVITVDGLEAEVAKARAAGS